VKGGGKFYLSGRVVGPARQASLSLAPLSQSGYSLDPRLRTFLRFIISRFDFFLFCKLDGVNQLLSFIFLLIIHLINFL
jgi:hypothetical protein